MLLSVLDTCNLIHCINSIDLLSWIHCIAAYSNFHDSRVKIRESLGDV